MTQKSFFGMDCLHITAGHQYWSHYGTFIVDIGGADGGKSPFYPPFDCIVKEINRNPGRGNWVAFQSLNPVEVPNAPEPITLCFRCTHCDNSNFDKIRDANGDPIAVGSIFRQNGGPCYYEGIAGLEDIPNAGNHIHLEVVVGEYDGWYDVNIPNRPGKIVTRMSTRIEGDNRMPVTAAFFLKNNTKVLRNDDDPGYYTNLYKWRMEDGTDKTTWELSGGGQVTPPPSSDSTGVFLRAKKLGFRIRKSPVNGDEVLIVPVGQRAEILEFLSIQSDNYQWAYVQYGNDKGYAQIDTLNAYFVEGESGSKTTYLNAVREKFRVRDVPVIGSELAMVPIGGRARIIDYNMVATDGYQWVKVSYGGYNGFAQADTSDAYTFSF